MIEDKIKTIVNLFKGKEIRSVWNKEEQEYYFSVVDVISVLTDSTDPRKYWSVLKLRLKKEGSEVTTNCSQLKMLAPDGKIRLRDALDTKGILRLIESVPSPNAEPFKMWLANLGKERIDEVFDPEIAVNRAIEYYRNKGYPDEWIKVRLDGTLNRKKLTDIWKEGGIKEEYEYAMLTNEIYKQWSGMNANDYKEFKGLTKESLRDNMTDVEIVLTELGELTTRDIATSERPKGLQNNLSIAKRGGKVSKIARNNYEKETGLCAVTNKNNINKKRIRYNTKKINI